MHKIAIYYQDLDGDGFENAAEANLVCIGDPAPANSVANNLDCDDNNPNDINLIINDNPIISGFYQSAISLTSNGIVSENSVITFQAGEEITLDAESEVILGGNLQAEIEGCGSNSSGLTDEVSSN